MTRLEVLEKLEVTPVTLYSWVKHGIITVTKLSNGRYDYDDESVQRMMNQKKKRKTVLYVRIPYRELDYSISVQINRTTDFCNKNCWNIDEIYKDVSFDSDYKNRTQLFKLLNEVMNQKIERIVITSKDRLSRSCFDLIQNICTDNGCEIFVLDTACDEDLERVEVFEDCMNFLSNYRLNDVKYRFSKEISDTWDYYNEWFNNKSNIINVSF